MAVDTICRSVTETPAPNPALPPVAPAPLADAAPSPVAVRTAGGGHGGWIAAGAVLLTALSAGALGLAWNTQQRVKTLEAELVRRQQDSGSQATEARTLARQAEVTSRETAAKQALLEARVAETSVQRSQLEDLIQSLARSRDENVLADLDAAIRVAMQQTAITGSAEPLVLTLKQADERLARYNQPRLERVHRAVAQDLERTRSAGSTDLMVLAIRLDEVIRQIDELPMQSAPERRGGARGDMRAARAASAPPSPASGASASASATEVWRDRVSERWQAFAGTVWQEVKNLVRVSRIEHPEAMLVAPEQAYFLRENLKLRLLNARLGLMSRQYEAAQGDLRDAQAALERYFDRGSRRVTQALEMLRTVAAQARLVTVPRPDATLAAIATASAGR